MSVTLIENKPIWSNEIQNKKFFLPKLKGINHVKKCDSEKDIHSFAFSTVYATKRHAYSNWIDSVITFVGMLIESRVHTCIFCEFIFLWMHLSGLLCMALHGSYFKLIHTQNRHRRITDRYPEPETIKNCSTKLVWGGFININMQPGGRSIKEKWKNLPFTVTT